jgi:hypothetical protein
MACPTLSGGAGVPKELGWPAGREADRTSAQRTAAVGLTDRESLSERALIGDCPLQLADDDVRTSAV